MGRPRKERPPTRAERSDEVYDYAFSLSALVEAGAPKDILAMLEHRLRSALREGPCPECPKCSLEHALEESTAEEPTKIGQKTGQGTQP